MADEPADPLLLGQRVVAILETGLRTATYKLATLTALVDHCIEHLPERTTDRLSLNPWIDDFGRSSAGFGELRWGVDTLARV
jgi:hypothetical protein